MKIEALKTIEFSQRILRPVPISGVSLLGGCMPATIFMNIVRDISTVISRVTFSPESGGKLNPRTAILR